MKNYFKASKKAAYKFKTARGYLMSQYKRNFEQINEVYDINVRGSGAISKPKNAYEMLKKSILRESEKLKDLRPVEIKNRLAELSRTELYSRDELQKDNLKSIFKHDKEALHYIRKELGWKNKIDWSKVEYHGDRINKDNRYYYITDKDGNKIAFKLGDTYKNKKKITFVALDPNGDVVAQFLARELKSFDMWSE